jgi:hypothetical protein
VSDKPVHLHLWPLLLKIEISTFDISSETTGQILSKIAQAGPWLDLFKNCVHQAHSPLKMAALTKNRNFLNIAITSSFGNELFNIYAVFVLSNV